MAKNDERGKFINKIPWGLHFSLEEELDNDERAWNRLAKEAGKWLENENMETYTPIKIKSFFGEKHRTQALTSDLSSKGCRVADFIDILRNSELEPYAKTFQDYLDKENAKGNTVESL